MRSIFNRIFSNIPCHCMAVIVIIGALAPPAQSRDDDERRPETNKHETHRHDTNKHDHHRHDHEVALKALQRGEILSLEKILIEVRKAAPGDIVDVELGRYHKSWVYRFKVLTLEASLITVVANAQTGVIVKIKLGATLEDDD